MIRPCNLFITVAIAAAVVISSCATDYTREMRPVTSSLRMDRPDLAIEEFRENFTDSTGRNRLLYLMELGNLMRQTASIDLPESDPELRQHLLDHLDDAGAKKSVLPHTQSSGHARRIRAIAAALVLGIGAWSFYQLNPGALQIADYDGLKYQQGTGLLDDTPTSTSSENRMRSIPETGKVFEMGDVAIVQVRDEVPHKNSAQNYTVDAPPSETPTTGLPDSDDWYVKKERRKKYEAIRLKVKPSIFAAPENSVTLLNGQTSSVPDGGTVILGGVKRMSGSDGPVAVMSGRAVVGVGPCNQVSPRERYTFVETC